MEFTWKKILLICTLFVGIVALPIFLMSNTMVEYYQRRADQEPNSGFNRWLLLNSSGLCYKTLRPELAAQGYLKFLSHYPEDPERPFVLLRYGLSLEEANRNADAIAVYEQYHDEYPNRPEAKEARDAIDRIKYVKPKK